MNTTSELEILDQLLDSGRKVHKYIEELEPHAPEFASDIKRRLNQLCDKALAIYFYGDKKTTEFQDLLDKVRGLLEERPQEKTRILA
jgi:hypothetical protein